MAKRTRQRSLFLRLFLGFVLTAGLIWTAVVGAVVYSALSEGAREARDDMHDYAEQVLSVVREFYDQPERLARAIARVEQIENKSLRDENDDDIETSMRIQVWVGNTVVSKHPGYPQLRPTEDGYGDLVHDELDWLTYTIRAPEGDASVRISYDSRRATIDSSQFIFLFIPLLFSMPVLLIPAWFMARRGLKPLDGVVGELAERTESTRLDPLTSAGYRELDTVVDAANSLMHRLDEQIGRERALVADIAHEIKTPLAVMKTNVDLISSSENVQTRDNAREDLNAGLDRCNHLLQQLLNLARMEQGSIDTVKAVRIDVAEFVRERVALLEPLARAKGTDLSMTAPDAHSIEIDVESLGVIIDNLVDNAIKYAGSGALVDVTLEVADSGATLVVSDNGPGIEADRMEQMFDRFTRGQYDGNGAGLGLSIVKRACERIGATVALSANPDTRGLRAVVTFSKASHSSA